MYLVGMSLREPIAIAGSLLAVIFAGFLCLLVLKVVFRMISNNHSIATITLLFGSLAVIGFLFMGLGGNDSAIITFNHTSLSEAPYLPMSPAIAVLDKGIEVQTVEKQIVITSGTDEPSLLQALRDAREGTKRAFLDAKVSTKRALRHASRAPLAQQIRGKPMSHLLTAVAIAAFLCVGYVFLDAGTRGHFTWRLRITAVVAFAAIWVAMASLRGQL